MTKMDLKNISINGRIWKMVYASGDHQKWESNWYCSDGDVAELFIGDRGFELNCFSGIPASKIFIDKVDFGALFLKSRLKYGYEYYRDCLILADWLCGIFCEWIDVSDYKTHENTIYEFVTPSDHITFKADDDRMAFACAIILGRGQASCTNTRTGDNLRTFMLGVFDVKKHISDFLGCHLDDYIDNNKQRLIECFKSFAYGDRDEFDKQCEAITDPEKLKEFKAKHEDENRSSLSRWVQAAWNIGYKLEKTLINEKEKPFDQQHGSY